MSVRNLDALFEPTSIAVVGASNDPTSVGHTLVSNLVAGGFAGAIYPVNPKYGRVQNLPSFARAVDLPAAPDLALVAIPAALVAGAVDELAARGARAVVVISAGFREAGPPGLALEQQLDQVGKKHDGLRILGPNCLGFMAPRFRLNGSFSGVMPRPGRVAFVSQSGALCTAVLDWARSEDVGFSLFLSLGNMLDIDFADTIDYLANDEQTEGLVLYVESVGRARDFLSAARAFTRRKPIVVYKAGRNQSGAQAAASHTGAMAGLDVAYDAAFRRAAIVRVYDSRELVNCAEMLARCRLPRGNRLAILTNAGGPGVMATDALVDARGQLAPLSELTIARLEAALPPFSARHNPVDILGDATPERFATAAQALMDDESVDALLTILTPQAMTRPGETAEALVEAIRHAPKPALAAWMGGATVSGGRQVLTEHGIPIFDTPEDAVRAFSRMADYASGLKLIYETPHASVVTIGNTAQERRTIVESLLTSKDGLLDELRSKELLNAYGIPCITSRIAGEAQPYPGPVDGVDMILGSRRDPTFGPVIMVGLGGTAAEIFGDCTFELPPLDDRLARRMLERLRIWTVLTGYRGRPALAIDQFVDVMLRFSTLVSECPQLDEVDLNPIVVSSTDVVALNARVLTTVAETAGGRRFGHLAVAPYPDRWSRSLTLKDGSTVAVRPIRPEDEPLWHELVDASSDQTFLARFRSLFRSVVHGQAARYCFIDYDREMAFVVVTGEGAARKMIAVGRLVADGGGERREFGLLVVDAWQRRGLGGLLLDLCLEYARASGGGVFYAETGWDNQPMLTLFRRRGFRIEHIPNDPTTVLATIDLTASDGPATELG